MNGGRMKQALSDKRRETVSRFKNTIIINYHKFIMWMEMLFFSKESSWYHSNEWNTVYVENGKKTFHCKSAWKKCFFLKIRLPLMASHKTVDCILTFECGWNSLSAQHA